MAREVWLVDVSYEDDDSVVFGPYTQRQAERFAARLVKEADSLTDEYGKNHHPHDVRHATAYPVHTYEHWLSTEEKKAARAAMREEVREFKRELKESGLG